MTALFDHEKLEVYRRSIEFIGWSVLVLEQIPKSTSTFDQLDRASTSIPLNIAEGNGRWTAKDRCRFFDTARGSALECAAALDVVSAKGFTAETNLREGKQLLLEIVRMLIGLIKANDPDREFGCMTGLRGEGAEYEVSSPKGEEEQDQGEKLPIHNTRR